MNWGKEILPKLLLQLLLKINPYLLAILAVMLAALACLPLSNTNGYHVVSFVLLFVVSILATFMPLRPILLASTLASLVWNFFFIPPRFTFHINKTEDILMFGMFFIIALLNGILTTRLKRQEYLAVEREERTNALFQLTSELSKASGIEEVLDVAKANINAHFASQTFFVLQDGNNNLIKKHWIQGKEKTTSEDFFVADWVFKNRTCAGRFTKNFESANYSFYPLVGARINPGVVIIEINESFTPEKETFKNTVFTLITNALEREFLSELAQKARLLVESDKLYKTLFNSISHELRIPVATIMGSADTLLSGIYPENIQLVLHNEIFTASLRLNRLIENLLNMSRLESGRISLHPDWCDITDLINKVTDDLKEELKPFNFVVNIPEDMPLIKIDFGLMEQVFYNLLINSCEHAPATTSIRVKTYVEQNNIVFEILDRGPGFPEVSRKNLFNKFFRVHNNKSGGLGLGLSIVKGFIDAHNGTVTVENRKNGGARFIITIPHLKHDINNLYLEDYERQ